jgi:hypothetical protein
MFHFSVKYGQLFGVSKPRKFKEALRMIIIDETISDDNDTAGIPIHFTFRTQKEASAAFRFVSEQYVFYSFEQVPLFPIVISLKRYLVGILKLSVPKCFSGDYIKMSIMKPQKSCRYPTYYR